MERTQSTLEIYLWWKFDDVCIQTKSNSHHLSGCTVDKLGGSVSSSDLSRRSLGVGGSGWLDVVGAYVRYVFNHRVHRATEEMGFMEVA